MHSLRKILYGSKQLYCVRLKNLTLEIRETVDETVDETVAEKTEKCTRFEKIYMVRNNCTVYGKKI